MKIFLFHLWKLKIYQIYPKKIYITVLETEESFELNNIIFINEKTIFGYSLAVKSRKKDQKINFFLRS